MGPPTSQYRKHMFVNGNIHAMRLQYPAHLLYSLVRQQL